MRLSKCKTLTELSRARQAHLEAVGLKALGEQRPQQPSQMRLSRVLPRDSHNDGVRGDRYFQCLTRTPNSLCQEQNLVRLSVPARLSPPQPLWTLSLPAKICDQRNSTARYPSLQAGSNGGPLSKEEGMQ